MLHGPLKASDRMQGFSPSSNSAIPGEVEKGRNVSEGMLLRADVDALSFPITLALGMAKKGISSSGSAANGEMFDTKSRDLASLPIEPFQAAPSPAIAMTGSLAQPPETSRKRTISEAQDEDVRINDHDWGPQRIQSSPAPGSGSEGSEEP